MFPQIRIHQTNAQIGLRRIGPVQEIRQIPAQLEMKQQPSKMIVEKQPAVLEVNQEQARNDLNLKNLTTLTADMAEEARNAGLEAIGQIAQEGNQLAAIEQKLNAITEIATGKSLPPPADTTITFIPGPGSVKINFTPAELKINWERGGVETVYTPPQTIHEYTPGKTEVYLRQRQQLEIDFVGLNVNNKS